jgi:hypothetical protein
MRLALLAAAVVALACSCSSDEDGGDRPEASGLVVRREDGSRLEFPAGVDAWCEDGEIRVVGGRLPREDEEKPPAFWFVSARVEEAESKGAFELPAGRLLFVYDPTLGRDGNDLSSAEEDSSGSVVFEEVSCDRGETIRVAIDVMLASEYGGAPGVDANGEVEAIIGDPQPIPD